MKKLIPVLLILLTTTSCESTCYTKLVQTRNGPKPIKICTNKPVWWNR